MIRTALVTACIDLHASGDNIAIGGAKLYRPGDDGRHCAPVDCIAPGNHPGRRKPEYCQQRQRHRPAKPLGAAASG